MNHRYRSIDEESENIEINKQEYALVGKSLHNLKQVQYWNNSGHYCLFAPNHLEPESSWRRQTAVTDDYPALEKVLTEYGIQKLRPVARGDMDMEIGNDPVKLKVYELHAKLWSLMGKAAANTLPIHINRVEHSIAARQNVGKLKHIIRTIKGDREKNLGRGYMDFSKVLRGDGRSNVAMYPYGNWFKPGEQEFHDTDIWPHSMEVPEGKEPGEMEGFELWRRSMKRGAFTVARLSEAPLVPIYVTRFEGKFYFNVGKPIDTASLENEKPSETDYRIQQEYLAEMRTLKEETENSFERRQEQYAA